MDLPCRQASSISLPIRAYNQARLRTSRQESTAYISPLHPQAGPTTILALPGLNRCLIATLRQRHGDRTGYWSLTAMDPILPWILSSTVIRIRFSWQYFPLIRRIRFSHLMWCSLSLTHQATQLSSRPTSKRAKAWSQSRKATSSLSSGRPG